MSEYMHLIGAEEVQSAGHSMTSAAQQTQNAANTISESVFTLSNRVEDWLMRFEMLVDRLERLKQ